MTAADNMDLQRAIKSAFPMREGMSLLADRILDHTEALYPEELASISTAIDRRRWEFATGRDLARRAMGELAVESGPILRGDQREPIWPGHVRGSITHAEDWAAACVARAELVRAVGIDLEIAARVGKDLHQKLFTERERAVLNRAEPEVAGLYFSAKEAGYKATFPLARRFIGFQEAEVDVDLAAGRFRLRYVGEHLPNRVMERGEGYFLFSGRYVLSIVIIPTNP